ncbi:hypothetical protein PsorP6_017784 [Peronosclerospora sorghi]|uniref:Uncharacterized protein n=1 Tax=Peronosclerospora sorghi TaxID=230839 RepID=A0ACC0WKV2_9STRA|nr:hypothetical protein PsorP6_017784 [Peronosclerospora sorghi]
MDPHAVNAMGMQGSISMPMSMATAGVSGCNPQVMSMGLNSGMGLTAYGLPPQQQQHMAMTMGQMNHMNANSASMKMNPNVMNAAGSSATSRLGVPSAGTDWRIQLTREHRANLIAKIYNEMVRVSADPVPGIKLWMNVSWYELTLYKESRTQEEYINKIFTRLKSLRAQQTDMNAVMAAQTLPNQGMLSRLDFSYYNTLNLTQRASASGPNGNQVGGFLGHAQFGVPGVHPGVQLPQQGKALTTGARRMLSNPSTHNGASMTPPTEKSEGTIPGDMPAEYWRQHAALKSKYHDDVEKVHNAFKKYVDHMKGHDETEQKKKLRYLLSYVQLCASILNEDKTTHAPRKIEELDKVYKYIVKIVNPYLKKLRTETDKRSFAPDVLTGDRSGMMNALSNAPTSGSGPTPAAASSSSGSSNDVLHAHHQMQTQTRAQSTVSLQQKQQHYLMQQRAQQMQQQRMQAHARQQHMMQQHHMMQQQSGSTQSTVSTQSNAPTQAPNGQSSSLQQTPQPNHQHQLSQRPQQGLPNQQHQPTPTQLPTSQPSHKHQQQQRQHPSHAQQLTTPASRVETSSLSLDDSFYGGLNSSGLLQMPSSLGPSGSSSSSSSGLMPFPTDLSPTNFSSMDLLEMDGFMHQDSMSAASGGAGHPNGHESGGTTSHTGDAGDSDLMFMEAL